jgi:hypothetical protein
MEERIGNYYRIRQGKRQDPESVRKSLQKGYGIQHPERINGYQGLFFGQGDVFASGEVYERMKNETFRSFVMNSLRLFEKENYGDISKGDIEENGESRWLGNGDKVFGRYGFYLDNNYLGRKEYDDCIRIRVWNGNTWIVYDSEPDMFLLLDEEKENGQDSPDNTNNTAVQGATPDAKEEWKTGEVVTNIEGIEFLREYRAHPEKYLSLSPLQRMPVIERENKNTTHFFWNAGILEGRRPYFARCWKMFHVINLTVYVVSTGLNDWDMNHLFVPMMIRRGLLNADDILKIPPCNIGKTWQEGYQYYVIHLVLKDEKPQQNIRWIGKTFTYDELNRLNSARKTAET